MTRSGLLATAAAAGALSIGLLAARLVPATPRAAAESNLAGPDLLASPKSADVVDAANAFLATLSESERSVARIDLTPRLAARWSNFPGGSNLRNGVFFKDLKPEQVAAALKVAKLAMSEEGFARFQEIRAADELLGKLESAPGGRGPRGPGGPGGGPGGPGGPGGGPGGPGGGLFEQSDANKDGKLSRDEAPGFLRDRFDQIDANKDGSISREEDSAFLRQGGPGGPGGPGGGPGGPGGGPGGPGGPGGGPGGPGGGRGGPGGGPGGFGGGYSAANYMIAILGTPSKTAPWLLQFGGHHLAFNFYYKGTAGAASPYFLAVEPTAWKDAEGKAHAPLAPMRDAMHGLVNSLTSEQAAKARLAARFSDIYVGPGKDARFPARSEGIPVSELSDASKAFVKRAIAAWTGDSAQAAEYRTLYEAELDRTKVAFSGSTTLNERGDYVRIDGPHAWIEFSCQNGIVVRNEIHYHTIWRDRLTDYGAEFSF